MTKIAGILLFLMLTVSAFAQYNIGDICANVSWTTTEGESTSIYDKVDDGYVVFIFMGQTW